jgi:hypothetical protein
MKKTLVTITSIVSFLFFLSCQKQDFTTNSINAKTTVTTQKFFTPSTTLNQRNASILKYLENVNAKTEFVVETVSKIGYPRWDKIMTTTSKAHGEARSLKDDSTVTSIIPFVREQDTIVNACIVVKTSPVDTSYYYLCDWQYSYIGEDNSTSYDQEKFAKFFMKLDKEVFDYKEFLITDSNLFSMYPQNVVRVKLNEPTTNLLEFCETTTVYYVDCEYPDSEECMNGCDHCYLCMNNIQWETCYTVEQEGGGAPPPGPPGTGGGGSGNGGGTTPPTCPGAFQNNGCGPGWVPTQPHIAFFNISEIINDFSNPCIVAAKNKLPNINLNIFANSLYFYPLSQSYNWKIVFEENRNLVDQNGNPREADSYPIISNNEWHISLNPMFWEHANLPNTTQETAGVDILHEIIHGFIYIYKDHFNLNVLNTFTSHEVMFQNFIAVMSSTLQSSYGISELDAKALALSGLDDVLQKEYTAAGTLSQYNAAYNQFAITHYGISIPNADVIYNQYLNGIKGVKCF